MRAPRTTPSDNNKKEVTIRARLITSEVHVVSQFNVCYTLVIQSDQSSPSVSEDSSSGSTCIGSSVSSFMPDVEGIET